MARAKNGKRSAGKGIGMAGAAILFGEMSPGPDWEPRFNKWCDTQFIPSRLAAPGFKAAQRYKGEERENQLVIFDLESDEALRTPQYLRLDEHRNPETKWILANIEDPTRYVGDRISDQRRNGLDRDPLDAPILFTVFFSVPDERAKEFNDWYTEEHVPLLLKNRHWLACLRYVITDGNPEPWTHLAVHYVGDASAFNAPERAAARDTPWRRKLAAEPWFQGRTLTYRRIGDRRLAKR
jgi:hypothetical protein